MQNLWYSTSWHFFNNLNDLMNSLETYKKWNVLKFHRSFPFIPHFATCSHYWIAVCNLLVFTKTLANCPYLLLLKNPREVPVVSPCVPMNWLQHGLSCSFLENISYSSSQTLTPKDSFGLWICFFLALFSLLLKSRHFFLSHPEFTFHLSALPPIQFLLPKDVFLLSKVKIPSPTAEPCTAHRSLSSHIHTSKPDRARTQGWIPIIWTGEWLQQCQDHFWPGPVSILQPVPGHSFGGYTAQGLD